VVGERRGYQIGTQPGEVTPNFRGLHRDVADPSATARYKINALVQRRF
jgi:hypothetical protein